MNEYEEMKLSISYETDVDTESDDLEIENTNKIVFHDEKPRYDYRPIALYDTSTMTHEEWLQMRQEGYRIGGSEAAAVLDKSPWVCSKELFDRKKGIHPKVKTEFNEENKKIGTLLEPIVQDFFILWFQKNYAKTLVVCHTIEEFNSVADGIYNDKHFYQCGRRDDKGNLMYPFVTGNVDGLIKINNKIGILEYKTTTSHGSQKQVIRKWRKGIPPEYYESQVRQYMGCLNLEYAFLVCVWGLSLQDMAAIYMERDYDIEDKLFEQERKFYQTATAGEIWDDSSCKAELIANYYTRLYGEVDPHKPSVQLSPAYFPVLEKMLKRTQQKEELKKKMEELEQEDSKLIALLSPILENASKCFCRKEDGRTIFVNISTPKSKHYCPFIKDNLGTKKIMDVSALKAEHPDIFDRYQETVFDVRTFKTEHPRLFAKYEYDTTPTGATNTYKAKEL